MSIKAPKKVNIFFDTNVLETRITKDMVMYGDFKLPSDYYRILDFLNKNNLRDDVELCIPEAVWKEIIQHMREGYIAKKQSFLAIMEQHKKVFGNLADIKCSFKIDTRDDYEKHLKALSKKFWLDNHECCKIPYPKNKHVVENLLDKALRKERPFVAATAVNGRKPYSDAGLKDALIVETILAHCNNDDTIGILFSDDGDFTSVFSNGMQNRFKVFKTADDIIIFLEKLYDLNNEKLIRLAFENDNYLKESVIKTSGNTYDKSVTDFIVDNVSPSEDENIFIVKISAKINETRYLYEIKYDPKANEILESKSTINDD